MSWINWYDLITPTNPLAALFFGIVISIVLSIFVWFETKEKKTTLVALLIGCGTSIVIVLVLNLVGFY